MSAIHGRRQYPQAHSKADGVLSDRHVRVAQPKHERVSRDVMSHSCEPGQISTAPETEVALQTWSVNRHRCDSVHAAIAVDVSKVGKVYRILRRLLGMAWEAQRPDLETAPRDLVELFGRQVPLRLPSVDAPPGEDQFKHFPGIEDSQLRRSGRVGVRGGDALAGCVELIAVEWTDEAAAAYAATGCGPQVGT